MTAVPFCPTCRRDETVVADGIWLRCDSCGASWIPDDPPAADAGAARAALPAVLLHYRDCACRGTGWLSAPGWPYRFACRPPRVMTIPLDEWVLLGRPKVADDLPGGYPNSA